MARRKNTAEAFEVLYRRSREKLENGRSRQGGNTGEEAHDVPVAPEDYRRDAIGREAERPAQDTDSRSGGTRRQPACRHGDGAPLRAPLRRPRLLRRPPPPDPILRSREGPRSVGRKLLREPAVPEQAADRPPARYPAPPPPPGAPSLRLARSTPRPGRRIHAPEEVFPRRREGSSLPRWLPSHSVRELREDWSRGPGDGLERAAYIQPNPRVQDHVEYDGGWTPPMPEPSAPHDLEPPLDTPPGEFCEPWIYRQTEYRDQESFVRRVGDIFSAPGDACAPGPPSAQREVLGRDFSGAGHAPDEAMPEMARVESVCETEAGGVASDLNVGAGSHWASPGGPMSPPAAMQSSSPRAPTPESIQASEPISPVSPGAAISSATSSAPAPAPESSRESEEPAPSFDSVPPSRPLPRANDRVPAAHASSTAERAAEPSVAAAASVGDVAGGGTRGSHSSLVTATAKPGTATPGPAEEPGRAPDSDDSPGEESVAGIAESRPSPERPRPARLEGPWEGDPRLPAAGIALVAATRETTRWLLGDGLSDFLSRRVEVRVGTLIGIGLATVVTCVLLVVNAEVKRESEVYAKLWGTADGPAEPADAARGLAPRENTDRDLERDLQFPPPMPLLGPMADQGSFREDGFATDSTSSPSDSDGSGASRASDGALATLFPTPPVSDSPNPVSGVSQAQSPGPRMPAPRPSDTALGKRYSWFVRVRGMCYREEAEDVKQYFATRLGYHCRLEPEMRQGQQETREGRPLFAVFVDRAYETKSVADGACDELKRKAEADPYEKRYMRNFEGAFAVRREVGPSPVPW